MRNVTLEVGHQLFFLSNTTDLHPIFQPKVHHHGLIQQIHNQQPKYQPERTIHHKNGYAVPITKDTYRSSIICITN